MAGAGALTCALETSGVCAPAVAAPSRSTVITMVFSTKSPHPLPYGALCFCCFDQGILAGHALRTTVQVT